MDNKLNARKRKKNRMTINDKKEALAILEDSEDCIKELVNIYFKENIKFKADSKEDFIDYLKKIYEFNKCEDELFKSFLHINRLIIERVEFDRDQSANKAVNYIESEEINKLHKDFCKDINDEEKKLLDEIEDEIKKDYLYAKDIELLKKILCSSNDDISESYDSEKEIKTLVINLRHKKDRSYIKTSMGTVEYHNFLNNNVNRLNRLLKNLDKYLIKESETCYKINQSDAIQDSVNMAVALFNSKKYRAVSGKNDISGYSKAPKPEEAAFKSCKVNKLGQMGFGYNRVNDSEKKIIETINKEIENGLINKKGKLTLITKWQPCPSCYLVLKQFSNLYKDIDIEVKYINSYGEK